MTNKQADALERIERFGISRTAWRLIVMAAFAMLAFIGAFEPYQRFCRYQSGADH